MKKIALVLALISLGVFYSTNIFARSPHPVTIGIMALGNIQLVDTLPRLDPGPGGGMYFDYRFNQRFSITVDAWATIHDGDGPSSGDNGVGLLGIPTTTIKMYFLDDEMGKWDPYAGLGIGVYAVAGSQVPQSNNGLGLGAQVELGFDYYLSDNFSVGFAGIFRSAGIITGLSGNNNATAIVPFTLAGKAGYHF